MIERSKIIRRKKIDGFLFKLRNWTITGDELKTDSSLLCNSTGDGLESKAYYITSSFGKLQNDQGMTNKMKIFQKSTLFVLLFVLNFFSFAQESTIALCTNGVDDDGDGRIDCFDNECSKLAVCEDSFFGNAAKCSDEVDVEDFAMRLQWTSDDNTADTWSTPVIGDLDQNGIPEVIVSNFYSREIFVFDGSNGQTVASRSLNFSPMFTPAIADVFKDGTAEILISEVFGDSIVLFSNDLNTKVWNIEASQRNVGLVGFADFNEDGVAEIYYKNEIINAETGQIIIRGNGDWEFDYAYGPLAIDVLQPGDPGCATANCAGLELVTGHQVWAVDIASGTAQVVKNMNNVLAAQGETRRYFPKNGNVGNVRSSVSAADYNKDGKMDILVSGAFGSNNTDQTTVFLWEVENDRVDFYFDVGNDFPNGTGRVNIGDVDGDGYPNANFVMGERLYSLDKDFKLHWNIPIDEASSGYTGCTLFDFNGDGKVETVYRSESSLIIIDGVNGAVVREIPCISRTADEYPVVADVDGDGASEICISCATNDLSTLNPITNAQFGEIRVFEADGESWMPSRDVWNQHAYFNVNVNDDLTIPRELQDHTLVFSDGVCQFANGTSIPFPNRPLNTFLTQSPILDENGCVEFVTPDLVISGNAISASPAICPSSEVDVTFTLTNDGDTDISGVLPVSYYAGDPFTGSAIYLDTQTESLINFQVGQSVDISHTVNGIGGNYTLFVVVNDQGAIAPPIAASAAELVTDAILECETSNNVNSVNVTFERFDLTHEVLNQDRRCDLSLTPNGSANVFFEGTVPGSNGVIYLENFDDLATGQTSDNGATAWTSSRLGTIVPAFFGVAGLSGTNVFQANDTGSGTDGDVVWTSQAIDISDHTDVAVTLDLFEDGGSNGLESTGAGMDFIRVEYEIRDNNNNFVRKEQFPTSGEIIGDFNFATASLNGLRPNSTDLDSLLIISVTMHNTGSSESYFVDNVKVEGVSEPVLKRNTEADGFIFRWYERGDFSTVIHTGSSFNQIAAGLYDVIAEFPGTNCFSNVLPVEIENRNSTSIDPHLVHAFIYEISPLDDCNTPNGSLGAFVYTETQNGTFPATATNIPLDTLGVADGYSFTWRLTSDATNTPIGIGEVLSNLTNQGYSVDVVEAFSGCSTSVDGTVSSGLTLISPPIIDIDHIIVCGGTGTLTASLPGRSSTDFEFEWYDGPTVKPVADFIGETYVVSDSGDYTVRAREISTSCFSNEATDKLLDLTVPPVADLKLVQNNTFCSGGGGQLSAAGDNAGTVIGYSFQWFKGANTLPANALPGPSEPTAFLVSDNPFELGGLTGGTYTVVVTDNATNCTDTLDLPIRDDPTTVTTTGTPIVTDISGCDLSVFGAIDASGLVPSGVVVSAANINQSFEEPLTTDQVLRVPGRGPDHGREFAYFLEENVPGWSTTASDDFIEFWNIDNTWTIAKPFDGNQFAELNAEQVSALFFDLPTNPGSIFEWSFYHRGRNGVDGVGVNIGSPTATVRQNEFSTDRFAWSQYSGTYQVPAGQNVTRFEFESAFTSTGNRQEGNFIDLVQFQLPAYRFELHKGTTASGAADTLNTTGLFNNLEEGEYVLVVYDNETGCNATEIPIIIDRLPENPDILTGITPDSNCISGSGIITATASMPTIPEPASYTYELYDGHDFSSPPIQSFANATGTVTFNNLEKGPYRVRAINDDTKCESFDDVSVGDRETDPIILTTSFSDNTDCGAGNGIVSVDEVDADDDGADDPINLFQFTWYDGPTTSSPILKDESGNDAENIAGLNVLSTATGFRLRKGSYTVVVETISVSCKSAQRTITIDDVPYTPDVTIQESPQTDCGPGNGALRAFVTTQADGTPCPLPDGCREAEGFTFQWSKDGVPLTDGPVIDGSDSSRVSGLIAGEYEVEVTFTALGCSETKSSTLSSAPIVPILSLDTKQDNEFCDPGLFNGELEVAVEFNGSTVSVLTGYTFTWFNGAGTTKTLNTSSTTNVLSGINGGTYSVAVQAPNSCASDTLELSIIDDLPVIAGGAGTPVNNSVCSPNDNNVVNRDFNGSITFNPTTDGISTTYAYALRTSGGTPIVGDGTVTTGDFKDVRYSDGVNVTVEGLPKGNYIMNVTDDASKCSVDVPFIIADDFSDIPVIVIGGIVIQPNAFCDPSNYNGRADASGPTAVTGGTGNYRFEWAMDSDPTVIIDNDAVLDGVIHGNYILTVIDDETGCRSASQSVEIGELLPAFTIDTFLESIDYSCDPSSPTGSIRAGVNGGSSGYTLEWYRGSSATGSVINTTVDVDNTISGLAQGTYLVKVTDNNTKCFLTETIEVIKNIPEISVFVTKDSDQNQCVPLDGKATATPGSSFPGGPVTTGFSASFTFEWYRGEFDNPSNLISGETAAILDNVAAGFYTVKAIETSSGCSSLPATVEIIDRTPASPFITIVADNIPGSCDALGGKISADMTGGATPYLSFLWYEGTEDFANNDPTGAGALSNGSGQLISDATAVISITNPSATETELDGITSGFYTLVVVDAAGCRHQEIFNLPFNGIQTTTTINVANPTQCPDNGIARVSLADNITLTVSGKIGTFNALEEFVATPSGATGTISSDDGIGTIDVAITTGSLQIGDVIRLISGTTAATVDNITGVGNEANQQDDIEEYIIYLYAGPGVPTDREARYEIINSAGDTLVFPYTYDPTDISGNVLNGDSVIVSTPGTISTGDTAFFEFLPAGPYTAVAREKIPNGFSSTGDCWTTPATDMLDQEGFEPIISSVTIVNDTFCNAGTGNGSIQITGTTNPDDVIQPNSFQFELFDAGMSPVTNPGNVFNATNTTFSNLNAGTYFVTVTRLGLLDISGNPITNGCDTTAMYEIVDNPEVHEIINAAITHNDDCEPLNGAATINDSDVTDNIIDYRFTWYFDAAATDTLDVTDVATVTFPSAPNSSDLAPSNAIANVPAGSYFVQAVHKSKGCLTPIFEVVINDDRVIPIVQVVPIEDNIVCDLINFTPTGQAIAQVVVGGVAQDPDDYIFTWFLDQTELDTVDVTDTDLSKVGFRSTEVSNTNTQNGQVGVNVMDSLPSGKYYVVATDNTGSLGCRNTPAVEVTINQFNTNIFVGPIQVTDFDLQHADDCDPLNGAYEILQVSETRPSSSGPVINISSDMTKYTFNWFESDTVTVLGNVTLSATFPNAPNGSQGASAVNNLPEGTYFVQITNSGETGCFQTRDEYVAFTIGDSTDVISIIRDVANSSDDTFCDNTGFQGDGAIEMDVMEDGASAILSEYTITWYRDAIASGNELFSVANQGSATDASGDLTRLEGLSSGVYAVEVVKNAGPSSNSGCDQVAFFNVGSDKNIVTLDEAAIQARTVANTSCRTIANGSITLTDADISDSDATGRVLSDYNILVIKDVTPLDTVFNNTGTSTTTLVDELEAGDYFLVAIDNATGCSSTATINVDDAVTLPRIDLVGTITPDEICGTGPGTREVGRVEVIIDAAFDEGDARFAGGNIQWFVGADTLGSVYSATDAQTVTISGVPGGTYTVRVRNGDTGCIQIATFEIPTEQIIPAIVDATISNNVHCSPLAPTGAYQLNSVLLISLPELDTADLLANDDSLRIFTDVDLTTLAPDANDNPASRYIWEGLPAGTYFAAVLRNDTKCLSEGSRFEILDDTRLPAININLVQADSSCSGGVATGELTARILDGTVEIPAASLGFYRFEWFVASAPSTPLVDNVGISNGSVPVGVDQPTISGLAADEYLLKVTLDSTGCTSMETFEVPRESIVVEIDNAVPTAMTNCSTPDGSVEITSMSRGNLSDYTFEYFNVDPTTVPTPSPVVVGDEQDLQGQSAGTYYVIGTHTASNCTTPVFQIDIPDNTIRPNVFLAEFENQTNCDEVNNPNGRLTISVDGSTSPSKSIYEIKWYRGGTADPSQQISGQDSATVINIAAGVYTVEVIIRSTGCSTTFSEQLINEINNPFAVSVSSSGNTECDNPNGSVSASVINPGRRLASDFSYFWFIGDVSSPDTTFHDFKGSIVSGLEEGEYTVVVIDKVDSLCFSNPRVVTVPNLKEPIPYEKSVQPVTVCDPSRSNGALSVSLDSTDLRVSRGQIRIEWFDAQDSLITTNPILPDTLKADQYRLKLTDVSTGCFEEEIIFLINDADNPDAPTVIVTENRTNCASPNASATASVNGSRNNLLFEWFDVRDPDTPYAIGSEVFNLDSTTYLVVATDTVTGCSSFSTAVTFDYDVVDIEFDMDVSVATCARTLDGAFNQFNTIVRVDIDPETNPILTGPGRDEFQLEATNFEWRNSNGEIVGTSDQIVDVPPGDYSVTFNARNGCTYSSVFTVTTDIEIYNGLSPNDDGLNDFLLIDCIDFFANNKVQIFNRDGLKVYEMDNYDNVRNRFEGLSNIGRGGLNLPTGTYFAIVQLNDGRPPIQFYLELVR
ncbi:MAG: gliding motility-associated C-terminal domain-containing protein [Bacteroidota bacterium]